MEYLLNDEQKELMNKIHQLNEQKLEKEKQEKHNPNELFKNKKNISIENEVSLTVVKKEKWYNKIFKILKKFIKLG